MAISLEALTSPEQLLVYFVLLATAFYLWSTHAYGYWKSLGVPYRQPLPILGNIGKSVFNIAPISSIQVEYYKYFKDQPYAGLYDLMTPKLMLRDPALIEQVAIKDFSSFTDRGLAIDPDAEGLSANLVNMKGLKWKSLRLKLTPVFSSGKLKTMMSQLDECSARLIDHLKNKCNLNEPIEAKDLMSGYTLDVIGSCAFGLDFNSITDPDSTFRKIGGRVFGPSRMMVLKSWLRRKFPKLITSLNFSSTSLSTQSYFKAIIKDAIKFREENNVKRNDFIQLLMEVKKQEINNIPGENEVVFNDRIITSNSFVFLLAGYETTASTISFMLYELSKNPRIQERVYKEVIQVLKKHNGEINWESLKDMVYLEQVISETLRLYPPLVEIRRTCTKDYIFSKTNLQIPAGTVIAFPVYALHHDEQYFPEPFKFDPDRFSGENKHKLVKCSYLPFGDGPRICIGMRFALMEVKMAVTRLIHDFSFTLHPKTISPLKFNPGAFILAPIVGIWINITPRDKEII